MSFKLYNTLLQDKQEFIPLNKGSVFMYHCGPTVYSHPQIGNLRSYVFADTIRRAFEAAGYKVTQVINITDVGHLTSDADTGRDKIEEGARREGKTATEIADFYTAIFLDNLKELNVVTKGTIFPKATDHIKEQTELIRVLSEKGYTYKTSDGIYFDTSMFKEYGKLGNIDIAGLVEGARVEINSEKRRPTDFALWKFSQPHEKRQQEWDSPWGVGFPGWHIECSAMSMKYLGETFDIHTGGIDHIAVHHNNEIAQSECATGKQYVRYWMHNAFLTVNGAKMAKSAGNFTTLQTLKDKGVSPLAYRYWLLTSHYRSPVSFSLEAVENAQVAFGRLRSAFSKIEGSGTILENYLGQFKDHIADDFDTPQAIATLWKMMRDKDAKNEDKKATAAEMDKVLGLDIVLAAKKQIKVPAKVKKLVSEREAARAAKDFKTSDELRNEIEKLGFSVKDMPDGPEIAEL